MPDGVAQAPLDRGLTGQAAAMPLVEETALVQLIVFHAGEEEFAVPIGGVREIVRAGPVTPIPDSPDFIKGLITVRGEVVATIDLKNRFFLSAEAVEPKHVLITQQEESLFGLLVDEVTEVLRIPQAEIKPPHKLMTKIHEEYVSGVVTHEGRLIILLDLARVLSVEDLTHLSEVVREHRERVEEPESVAVPAPPARPGLRTGRTAMGHGGPGKTEEAEKQRGREAEKQAPRKRRKA